jgi:alpha-glucosidase
MSRFDEILRGIRFAGLGNCLSAVRYARLRDHLNRIYREKRSSTQAVRNPGRLNEVSLNGRDCFFQYDHAALEVSFLAGDLTRITWSPGIPPVPYALAKTEWPEVEIVSKEENGRWILSSDSLQVTISTDGSLSFHGNNGQVLRRELPPERKPEGAQASSWKSRSVLQPDECLFGLGEQAGKFNIRGQIHRLWNTDPGGSYGPGQDPLYMPLPVYAGIHSQGSYLIFFENSFPAEFEFGKAALSGPDCCQIIFEGGLLRYYFIPGPPSRAIERYTELTGRPALPPRWSLGYHQCRWGYKTEADILQVTEGFQAQDMPLSAIHLDIDYMDGYRVFTVDSTRFPDLPGLAARLQEQGIRLVTIIDPGIKRDKRYFLYRQGMEKRLYCTLPNGKPLAGLVWPGWSVYPDFTNAQARAWWGDQYSRLLDMEVSGFWHDMNEPASFAAAGDMTLPLATCHAMEGRGGDHREAHNLYGLLMNRAGMEGIQRARPGKRPWLISRAGWAGSQRYAWNWTGDTESTWQGLRATLATVLGLGLSGQPFSGPDTGGFSGDPPAELYIRWFQMAAMLPFFRTHSAVGTSRREPWVFGEPTTSIARNFLKLRYRLLPYLYTLAWEASQTGHPLVRPLFWEEPDNPALWQEEDAFLLGSTLLVAPILEENAQSRELLLPSGTWYNWWDGRRIEETGRVHLPVSLEQIPVLARGGSLLPLEEGSSLILDVYAPGLEGKGFNQVYSDAGEGIPSTEQDWRLDLFHMAQSEGQLEISWESRGRYTFPYSSVTLHLHGFKTSRAFQDGKALNLEKNIVKTGEFHKILFEGS